MAEKSVVFLVDMNAFFISCETSRHPDLKGKCAAVAGDPKNRTGIILAANYSAREKGVRTAMTVAQALGLCPDILLVPPDHKFYGEISSKVMTILDNYTPTVEQNSIDEAWLDMTGTAKLFGPPKEAAEKIMQDISSQLDLMCSIGIAENKFLAKMASEMKKPMGITTLWPHELKEKLWPLPVGLMYGVGKKTAEKLHSIGIKTIGDLSSASTPLLSSSLGKYGSILQLQALGMHNEEVISHSIDKMKSIGRSCTLNKDAYSPNDIRLLLLSLSESVAYRARRHSKTGRTIQITIKKNDFSSMTRQCQSPNPTCYTDEIFELAWDLMQKNWPKTKGVRLIGVSLTGFEDALSKNHPTAQVSIKQLSFEDFLCPKSFHLNLANDSSSDEKTSLQKEQDQDKKRKLEKTMDDLRQKYGHNSVKRASLMKSPIDD